MADEHQTEQLSEKIKTLVRGRNFGHLATLMRDGAPHVDPVWVDIEGDTILVCSGTASKGQEHKARSAHRTVGYRDGQPL